MRSSAVPFYISACKRENSAAIVMRFARSNEIPQCHRMKCVSPPAVERGGEGEGRGTDPVGRITGPPVPGPAAGVPAGQPGISFHRITAYSGAESADVFARGLKSAATFAARVRLWPALLRCRSVDSSDVNKLCGRPPQYAPAPCKSTFDLLTMKAVSVNAALSKAVW